MPKSKDRKDKEGQQGSAPIREYTDINFDSLVDSALGLVKDQEQMEEGERKIMKGLERDILRMMHDNEWQKISEFKYRYPHLRLWVDKLEYRYWSQKDVVNSHWQQ